MTCLLCNARLARWSLVAIAVWLASLSAGWAQIVPLLPPVSQPEPLPPVTPAPVVEEVPAPATEAAAPPVTADGLADVPVVVEADAVPKLWSGNFDMGLNGSEGNNSLFNFRFNLAANREDAFSKLTLKSNYARMSRSGAEGENRLFFEGRNEWKFGDSPWNVYVHETTEYDEFREWRTRIGLDTGLGYALIKNDLTTLTVRGGPSVSHEFRGPDREWVPEIATGLQLDHKLSERQKLYVQIDYFPDVRDFNEYRINTQASWEIVLDAVNNLSLKLSAISRYDTSPDDGQGPDDLDYAATLLWSF
jgi:putative salt-induced outer membrane protein YdiY